MPEVVDAAVEKVVEQDLAPQFQVKQMLDYIEPPIVQPSHPN